MKKNLIQNFNWLASFKLYNQTSKKQNKFLLRWNKPLIMEKGKDKIKIALRKVLYFQKEIDFDTLWMLMVVNFWFV